MTATSLSVRCPACETEFPIDPRRVPRGGIPVICSACSRVFRVEIPLAEVLEEGNVIEPGSRTGPAIEAEPVVETEPELEVEDPSGSDPFAPPPVEDQPAMSRGPTTGPEASREGVPDQDPFDQDASEDEPSVEPVSGTLSAAAARFGRRSPSDRARRLARVLVSDMITYHPARYEEARENGTLAESFSEEIDKSWKEYVDQVGDELAESTDFFVEALNEILARGERIFEGTGRPG